MTAADSSRAEPSAYLKGLTMYDPKQISYTKAEYDLLRAEKAKLRNALGEIADPSQCLSLDLNLRKSNLSKQQWAKAILNNTLSWDKGYMVIETLKVESWKGDSKPMIDPQARATQAVTDG